MQIKIEDYLSDFEMKEIALEEFRKEIRSKLNQDLTTIMTNACYRVVFEEVDNNIPLSKDQIREKTLEILNQAGSYTVFRNHWQTNKAQSLASIIVEEYVAENKELIKNKVIEVIKSPSLDYEILNKIENTFEDFSSLIADFIHNLKKENKKNEAQS